MFFFLALVGALDSAIEKAFHYKGVNRWKNHERVKRMYSWTDVAERTEKVSITRQDVSKFY